MYNDISNESVSFAASHYMQRQVHYYVGKLECSNVMYNMCVCIYRESSSNAKTSN